MEYNEIYNICQPVMDWLKENYPHNHKIVINTNGAELIECGKLVALDKSLTSRFQRNEFFENLMKNGMQKEHKNNDGNESE